VFSCYRANRVMQRVQSPPRGEPPSRPPLIRAIPSPNHLPIKKAKISKEVCFVQPLRPEAQSSTYSDIGKQTSVPPPPLRRMVMPPKVPSGPIGTEPPKAVMAEPPTPPPPEPPNACVEPVKEMLPLALVEVPREEEIHTIGNYF